MKFIQVFRDLCSNLSGISYMEMAEEVKLLNEVIVNPPNIIKINLNNKNFKVNLRYQYETDDLNNLLSDIVEKANKNGHKVNFLPPIPQVSLKNILLDAIEQRPDILFNKLIMVLNVGIHWVSIVVEPPEKGKYYTITYMNSLNKNASIQFEIQEIFKEVLNRYCINDINFKIFPKALEQPNKTLACGAYSCENLRRYIFNEDLDKENVEEGLIRAQHINILGKVFAIKQLENKPKPVFSRNHDPIINDSEKSQVDKLEKIFGSIKNQTLKEELENLFIKPNIDTCEFLRIIRNTLDKYYNGDSPTLDINDKIQLDKFTDIIGVINEQKLKVEVNVLEGFSRFLEIKRFELFSKSLEESKQKGQEKERIIREKFGNNQADLRLVLAAYKQLAHWYYIDGDSDKIDKNSLKKIYMNRLKEKGNFENLMVKYSINFEEFDEYSNYLQFILEEKFKDSKTLHDEKKKYAGIGILGDYNKNKGFQVKEIFKDSPAEKMGLCEEDVITYVYSDNKKVSMLKLNPSQAMFYLRGKLGTILALGVTRNNTALLCINIVRDAINLEYKTIHDYVKHAYIKNKVPMYVNELANTEGELQEGAKILQKVHKNISDNQEKYANITAEEKEVGKFVRKTIKHMLYDGKSPGKWKDYTSLVKKSREVNINERAI